MALFDLGDGKTPVRVDGPDGQPVEVRIGRVAWMRWWNGLAAQTPGTWHDLVIEKFARECGITLNVDQAEDLLWALREETESLQKKRQGRPD